VTNRQSVDSKKIRVPLEPLEPLEPECQVGGIRVGLEHKIHPMGKFVQSIGSQLIL